MKLNNIIKGWKNWITEIPEIEKLAEERVEECIKCPSLKLKKICGECGCIVAAKIRVSEEECPLKKWKSKTINYENL